MPSTINYSGMKAVSEQILLIFLTDVNVSSHLSIPKEKWTNCVDCVHTFIYFPPIHDHDQIHKMLQ